MFLATLGGIAPKFMFSASLAQILLEMMQLPYTRATVLVPKNPLHCPGSQIVLDLEKILYTKIFSPPPFHH